MVKNDIGVMMIPDKFQLVVHYVMVISIENFIQTRAQIRHQSYGNQSRANVREIYYTTNFDREYPKESRGSTDLPVSFKAPDIESQNFWNYHNTPTTSNRRTFLGDLGYFNHGKTNLFPNLNSFFEFMNPLLDKANIFKPMPPAVTKGVSEPYRYEYPYNFGQSTERNFLPPPKPIRASIVKLETITRSPGPFEYINSSEDFPHLSNFKPIPKGKPISLYIDELGFHPTHKVKFKQDPSWISKPEEFSSTRVINNISSTIYIPSSAEVHQQSVKVMPSLLQEILINDNNHTDKQILINTTKENISSKEESGNITFNINDSLNEEFEENFRNSSHYETGHLDRKRHKDGMESQISTTLVDNKHLKSETGRDVEETTSIHNTRSYKRGNSIKIVTELTLEGLSKNNQTANIPKNPKFINMSELINYELNKIARSRVPRPRLDEIEENEKSLSHSLGNHSFSDINESDELSLDLKILKDTNWDGFTTEVHPSVQLIEIRTNQKEENSGQPNNNTEIDYSYDTNKENNSKANYTTENEEIHDNKTIIVETRVTKSITKALPITHRQTYKKFRRPKSGVESLRNIANQTPKSSNLSHHTSKGADSKSEVAPQSTKGKDYIVPSNFTVKYETSNRSKNAEFRNETIIMINENLNGSKDNGLKHNQRIFNSTRLSRNGIYGKTSERPNLPTEEFIEVPVNNATDVGIEQNFDLDSESYYSGNVSRSNIMTITEIPRASFQNETDNVEAKNIRKRKQKRRQKLKRRRTGKRRQNNNVTTGESSHGLINSDPPVS